MSNDPTQVRIEGDDIVLTLPTDSTNTEYLISPTLAMQIGTALIAGSIDIASTILQRTRAELRGMETELVEIRGTLQ